ncbi:MAG: hypothetical protein RLZZ248_310 [Bacteroidota bacterium]|jgi:predicted KAP-like P-loop ATPase
MRWVADIEHEIYKIVVLQMGERYLLQVEDGSLIQTFKFKIPDEVASVTAIKDKVDTTFLEEISLNFREMKKSRNRFLEDFDIMYNRFPEII